MSVGLFSLIFFFLQTSLFLPSLWSSLFGPVIAVNICLQTRESNLRLGELTLFIICLAIIAYPTFLECAFHFFFSTEITKESGVKR
jgi:hypothetical protein